LLINLEKAMAVRVFGAAVLSTALMFAWGFVYWGPVINATSRLTEGLPAETELDVLAPMRAANLPDGMYLYPPPLADMGDKAAEDAWKNKIKEGPLIHMAYHQSGVSPMEPMMFAQGLVHNFVIALLSGGLLAMVVHTLPSYASRVGLLTLVTIIAALWTNVGNLIWWFHTPEYIGGQIVYAVVSGMLMALVTAAIVRPAPAAK
jgi:hypothetical protein